MTRTRTTAPDLGNLRTVTSKEPVPNRQAWVSIRPSQVGATIGELTRAALDAAGPQDAGSVGVITGGLEVAVSVRAEHVDSIITRLTPQGPAQPPADPAPPAVIQATPPPAADQDSATASSPDDTAPPTPASAAQPEETAAPDDNPTGTASKSATSSRRAPRRTKE